jgi:hypothetical protein
LIVRRDRLVAGLALLVTLLAAEALGGRQTVPASRTEEDRLARIFGQKTVEGFSLLLDPIVQKTLKMERAQVLRIIARDQAAQALIETASPPPDPKDIPTLTKRQEELREQAVQQLLTEGQRKRLQQILAQQQGASLLLKKEMEQELKLSDSQRYVLYSIHQETIKKVKALPGGAKQKSELRKIRLSGFNHMLRALTPDQRKKFRSLLGPPVRID